ncbi:hypothetical protein [Actinomadura litoris]|uniref:hypothetical protein n=1 Tax=Actinomadura litoris TaxID=2678616 RepID=UPI001FA73B92|nr:hypothetical protein [Actinomadura litoris]
MPFVRVNPTPDAQARRARVRARDDATTTTDTHSDGDAAPEASRWVTHLARTLAKQPPLATAPPTVRAMSARAAERAAGRQRPLPRLLTWLGWYSACAVCCALLAVAYLAHLPYGRGALGSLADLTARVHRTAQRQPTGPALVGYYAVGAACIAVCAATYAAVYAIQYPALLVLLTFCGGVAWLTAV